MKGRTKCIEGKSEEIRIKLKCNYTSMNNISKKILKKRVMGAKITQELSKTIEITKINPNQ